MQPETSHTEQSASLPVAPADIVQHIVLNGSSCITYERLLAEHAGRYHPRFTYDRGALGIMVLSLRHEKIRRILGVLVEIVAEIFEKDIEGAATPPSRDSEGGLFSGRGMQERTVANSALA